MGLALKESENGMVITDKEKFQFSNGWENLTEDIDEMLVTLERRVKTHFSDTIFFIYSHLLDHNTNEIKKVNLVKIKEIVKKLDLKAMGYIECCEAVVGILEEKDEMPFTGISVELDNHFASIFVYKSGKVAHKTSIERSPNLVEDLKSTFSVLSDRMLLPGKIVLYNGQELDKEVNAIVGHKWDEKVFIQIPKVEIIKEEELLDGLIGVFESQMDKKDILVKDRAHSESEKEEVLGFKIGADVGLMKKETVQVKSKAVTPAFSFLSSLSQLVKKVFSKASMSMYIIAGVLIIFLSIMLNELFLHTARLKVFLPSQVIKKELELQNIVVGEEPLGLHISTNSAEFTKTIETTGQREVGEKAKGEVTVYSFDDKSKLIPKDSALVFEGIKFATISDVQVASASEVLVGGNLVKQPGKNKVTIVASEIGVQANLDKGKRFQFESLPASTYFAINDSALSGGSKKSIRTVSKQDLENANGQIINDSKKKVPTLEKSGGNDNIVVIEQLSRVELDASSLSHEIGEESESLTVKTQAVRTDYLIEKNKLVNYLSTQLKAEAKKGFAVPKEKISYKITKADEQDGEVSLNIVASAKALQVISKEELMRNLVLKNKSSVETTLKDRYGVNGYELTIHDPLFLLKNFMPIRVSNIQLEIVGM